MKIPEYKTPIRREREVGRVVEQTICNLQSVLHGLEVLSGGDIELELNFWQCREKKGYLNNFASGYASWGTGSECNLVVWESGSARHKDLQDSMDTVRTLDVTCLLVTYRKFNGETASTY